MGARIRTPPYIAVLAGNNAMLLCEVDYISDNIDWAYYPADGKPQVVIVKNCKVENKFVDDYSVMKSSVACFLVIKKARLDMAVKYSCSDRLSYLSSSSELTVIESKPSCKSSADGEKFLKAGTEVTFTCSVRYAGESAPSMEWYDEKDRSIPSVDKSDKNHLESSIIVKAEDSSLKPYACRTSMRGNRDGFFSPLGSLNLLLYNHDVTDYDEQSCEKTKHWRELAAMVS